MGKSPQEKQLVRLEATLDAYREEIWRLRKAVAAAEEDAAKWRRRAKKLKKRESTVILDAAPELVGLPDIGDAVSA